MKVILILKLQLKNPSHPYRAVPTAINCLAILLRESSVRASFVQTDSVKLLVPLISPASTQQSIQVTLPYRCLLISLGTVKDCDIYIDVSIQSHASKI